MFKVKNIKSLHKRTVTILIILLTLVTVAIACCNSTQVKHEYSTTSIISSSEDFSEKADLNKLTEDSKMSISIKKHPILLEANKLYINFINSESNKQSQQIEIFDSEDNSLYKSNFIEPGYSLENIVTSRDLKANENVKAVVSGFEENTKVCEVTVNLIISKE